MVDVKVRARQPDMWSSGARWEPLIQVSSVCPEPVACLRRATSIIGRFWVFLHINFPESDFALAPRSETAQSDWLIRFNE